MVVVASFDDVEWRGGRPNHRGSNSSSATLLEGDPSRPDNYWLAVVRMGDSGGSPRHRHDFDQIRYPLTGGHPYAPRQEVPVGWVGYFPEGVRYGPFDQVAEREYLILQCGGATGHGYVSREGWRQATAELSVTGAFKAGFYEYDPGDGSTRRQDALEAILEHSRGRPVDYPKARYMAPVVLDPEAFEWMTVEGEVGVCKRQLVTFNERGTSVSELKLDPGATHVLLGAPYIRLLFLSRGQAKVSGDPVGSRSAASVDAHETGVELACPVGADAPARFLIFSLPQFEQ